MKTLPLFRLLMLLFVAAAFVACNDDDFFDDDDTPPPPPPTSNQFVELALDGPNATGPVLQAGLHRFGVRFTEADLRPFVGQELAGISVFVGRAPASMYLSVIRGGETVPGIETLGFDTDLSNVVEPGFYDYLFDEPIVIDDAEALWLQAEVELTGTQQSIGCDAGPAQSGGDWLWSSDRWLTYRDRTNGSESVNWNIRGLIE